MQRRFTFLGFELYWFEDRQGTPQVKWRTARRKLQAACRRIRTWIEDHCHLAARDFSRGLNRRVQGHYNVFGVRGNSRALYRFDHWAIQCTFKWLNRRGGKRRSLDWEMFTQALERMKVARPGIIGVRRRRVGSAVQSSIGSDDQWLA